LEKVVYCYKTINHSDVASPGFGPRTSYYLRLNTKIVQNTRKTVAKL